VRVPCEVPAAHQAILNIVILNADFVKARSLRREVHEHLCSGAIGDTRHDVIQCKSTTLRGAPPTWPMKRRPRIHSASSFTLPFCPNPIDIRVVHIELWHFGGGPLAHISSNGAMDVVMRGVHLLVEIPKLTRTKGVDDILNISQIIHMSTLISLSTLAVCFRPARKSKRTIHNTSAVRNASQLIIVATP